MAQKTNGQIVRYQKGKIKFEILTKKGAALKYKQGKLGLQYVCMIDTIYSKISQGKIAKSADLKRVFGTDDFNECVMKILENGDLNLSSTERKQKTTNKRNEIIYYINKNYVNPLSNLPHPSTRISNCMDECKIRIDAAKSTKTQALNAIKKMSGKLFFKKANMLNINLTIKYKYDINKIGQIINKISGGCSYQQKWNDNGCTFVMDINKGDLEELGGKLNSITNGGDYHLKVIDENINNNTNAFIANNKVNNDGVNKKKSKRNKQRQRDQYLMDEKDRKKQERKRKKKKRIIDI